MENSLLLAKARAEFIKKNYAESVRLYKVAQQRYPHFAKHLETTIEAIKKSYPAYAFGLSYDVKTKEVPALPENFPSWLTLPPLKGVANDYSPIQADLNAYWKDSARPPVLPVSIVVPVYNRSHEVDFVLAGLTHQTYPKPLMEVIIADDGSQEDLSLVYKKYQNQLTIRYCRQEDLGYRLAEARNMGVATASHDSIIILDSDAIPNPNLVMLYMRYFHVTREAAMFGLRHYVSVNNVDVATYVNDASLIDRLPKVKSENTLATRQDSEGFSVDWRESDLAKTDQAKTDKLPYRFLVGANCAFSRELFDRVGGYSEDFKDWGFEDQEFGYRLLREGAYFIPVANNHVYHQEPLAGKNDTDRKLGQSKTKSIYIEKCPFIYRKGSDKKSGFEAPLVSLYIPLYNRERYIAECVQSALEQTVTDLEIVICNDGSTDRSADILHKYFRHEKRVRLINKPNGGIASASNVALQNCKGFYIGQLDADDVLKKDAVSQCLEVIDKDPRIALVYGTTEYIDENSTVVSGGWNWPIFSREYLLTRMLVHHFRFFRKRDWARTSGFDESLSNAVDYDIALKLAEKGEVVHLNKVLYQYRRHGEMTTVTNNTEQSQNNYIVINKALKRLGLDHALVVPAPNGKSEREVEFRRI